MIETEPQRKTPDHAEKGLVIVNTGNGKGKTTAALGTVFRACGWGMRCCVIQFIKSEKGAWGETRTAERLDIEWHQCGDGFTWQSKDLDESAARARHAWETAKGKIVSGDYALIVLDEFTYLLKLDWLDVEEVVAWLRANKPPMLHLIITGRDAPAALQEYADLVTEMHSVKHPFDEGILAQRGIEF